MSRTAALLVLLLAVVALALRLSRLDARPMHNDEGVNALKFGQFWEQGSYKYDPQEHHGPTLTYAMGAFAFLTRTPDFDGFTEARFRALTILFGIGLVLLLPLVCDGLGRQAMVWAALFTAVSPVMVFYSRYYIHEMLLVFFTFLAVGLGWRHWRSRKPVWALLGGVAIGLMQATKETFVLALAAAVLALGLSRLWNRFLDASEPLQKPARLKRWPLAAGFGLWLAVAGLLFSSFLQNPAGLLDSLRTYQPWLSRAEGATAHLHSWSFYLHRLLWFHAAKGPVWTESFILLLAVVGAAAGFRHRGLGPASAGFIRFLAFYTFVLTALYSSIPYKTPWCLLSFWHGTILLAGVGSAVLVRCLPRRIPKLVLSGFLLAGAAHLAWLAWQASVPYAADRRNPYVYAQTSRDILNLVSEVSGLAQTHPDRAQMFIQVAAPEDDYGPLPWYLRGFKRVAWSKCLPDSPLAPVIIASAALHSDLDKAGAYQMVQYFDLRPGVPFELYVQPGLWRDYLRAHPVGSE